MLFELSLELEVMCWVLSDELVVNSSVLEDDFEDCVDEELLLLYEEDDMEDEFDDADDNELIELCDMDDNDDEDDLDERDEDDADDKVPV